jgi:hypothetical protein
MIFLISEMVDRGGSEDIINSTAFRKREQLGVAARL